MNKKIKEQILGHFPGVMCGMFLAVLVLGFCQMLPSKPQAKPETTYEEYVKEWNENIRSGIFGYRINDEKLIMQIHKSRLRFVDDIQGGITFITSDSAYKKVTYIDTTTQEVRTEWIRANLIKPTHSNWGLTQDVWALDRRLAEIEGKGMGISDNPLKPIEKETE